MTLPVLPELPLGLLPDLFPGPGSSSPPGGTLWTQIVRVPVLNFRVLSWSRVGPGGWIYPTELPDRISWLYDSRIDP